ncbi:MAG: response regulator [bacterium]|jgi:two-component system chemotaxis response regulator CheY|nr:response regulator [bacterium]
MGIKLLIVDDSHVVHAMVEKSFAMAGVEFERIHHAYNGQEGLAILAEEPVDLVLSDIHMPVMDGVEMIETMKRDPALTSIPVVIISTEGSKKRIDHLIQIGIADFIRKPFTPEKLKDLISLWIGA